MGACALQTLLNHKVATQDNIYPQETQPLETLKVGSELYNTIHIQHEKELFYFLQGFQDHFYKTKVSNDPMGDFMNKVIWKQFTDNFK